MGLWSGWNPSIKSGEEEEIIRPVPRPQPEVSPLGRAVRRTEEARFKVGEQVGRFAGVAIRPQPDFSQEQMALKQMFGGGDKIWGTNQQPVTIHNDLNPRQRGDTGTAELFGF